jgi:hypothetical protein
MMDCTKLRRPAPDPWEQEKAAAKRARADKRDANARRKATRAAEAIGELWATAEWSGARLDVDANVLLGAAMMGAPAKWLAFTNTGTAPCDPDRGFELSELRAVKMALRGWLGRAEVKAWFEGGKLHLRWRGGLGGLDLWMKIVPERVEPFHVVLPAREEREAS